MSDIERDAGRELPWERPPKVRSQLEASQLFAWLRIFGDEGPASSAPTPESLEAQRNIRAMAERLGVTGEAEDCTATHAVKSGRAKLSRDRAARVRWVDTLATEFKIEQHRKELDGAIKKSANAYCLTILGHWRGAQGRSDNRSAQQFFRNIKAAAKELRTSQALRNRLEDAAQLINRVETITTSCGALAVDPEDEISVARATGALSTLLALESVALQLGAKKPPRGSHQAIQSACKPLQVFWTEVAGRGGSLYHSGEETSELPRFLSHCSLMFDHSATPRTVVRACSSKKKHGCA